MSSLGYFSFSGRTLLHGVSNIPPTLGIRNVLPASPTCFFRRVATNFSEEIHRVNRRSEVKHVYIIYYTLLFIVFSFRSYSYHEVSEEEVTLISFFLVV